MLNDSVKSEEIAAHGKPYSIEIKIPPLGMCVFKIERLLKTRTKKNKELSL